MATKVWSSNQRKIIRDADADTVKRWMPSSGFAREGSIITTESHPKKSISPSGGVIGASDSLPEAAEPSRASLPIHEIVTPMSPTEEALVSVAALRLLPEELESLRNQAFKEGGAEGYERGYLEGVEAGKVAAESSFEARFAEAFEPRLQEAQAPFVEIVQAIEAEVPKLDAMIAQQILDLALVLAQYMTCRAVAFHPTIILAIMEEAIHALPREARGWLQIHAHPEDAVHIRKAMSVYAHDSEQRIIEDPRILKGGCRLVSRLGELDATLEARWQTVLKNLGRDDTWLSLDI